MFRFCIIALFPVFLSLPCLNSFVSRSQFFGPKNHHHHLQSRNLNRLTMVASHFQAPASAVEQRSTHSSLISSSTNLLKNCVGAGVFSLASRVASQTTNLPVFPAAALVLIMAAWATYNFHLVGETCRLTNSTTFPECWSRTVGPDTEWLVQSTVIIAPIVSCLANTIVLADVMSLAMQSFGAPLWLHGNRPLVTGLLGAFILYPLCIQRSLAALRSVSAAGIMGHLTAMLVLAVRIFDGSYFPGGKYYVALQQQQALTLVSTSATASASLASSSSSSLLGGNQFSSWCVLASLLSYCLVTHYNAPRYYLELQGRDKDPLKFSRMAALSYSLAALIYMGSIWLPIRLFGPQAQSFSLNLFSPADPLATVARICFGFSVLASFPLIFINKRTYFVSQAQTRNLFEQGSGRKRVTTFLLVALCAAASQLRDIGVIGSIAGAVLGSSMMFIFPPLMYLGALRKFAGGSTNTGSSVGVGDCVSGVGSGSGSGSGSGGAVKKTRSRLAYALNVLLLACGAALGLFGAYNSVLPLFT